MSKFKDYIQQLPDNEYREIDAFSYSLGKAIDDEGPKVIVDSQPKTGPALEFGSLVDMLITDPESVSDKFWTKAIEKPTASLLELADALLIDALVMDLDFDHVIAYDNVTQKIKDLGLWSSMKDANKIAEKWGNDLFFNYVKESLLARGKIILTPETLELALHCADVLKTHDFTKQYFTESEDIEIIYQAVIVFKFKGVICKAKLDLIVVDHQNKIIHPFDIKTGAKLPSKFQESFYEYKYYLQVISYLLAIQYITESTSDFKDYKIDTFKFLYVSKKLPDVPVVFEVPEKLLNNFIDGWSDHTGFMELLMNYKFAKENECYNMERKVMEKNGMLKIELQ
jgi:hypothetical protein